MKLLTAANAGALIYPGHRELPEDVADSRPPIFRDIPLFPKQDRFVNGKGRVGAFVGGVGSGKSHGLMTWCGLKMYRNRMNGTVGGIYANTEKQLSQSTLPALWEFLDTRMQFEEKVDYVYSEAPPRSWGPWPTRFKKNHKGILSIRWWGQAIVRSLTDPDTARGTTLGWAAMDETRDTTKYAFDVVNGRLRCPKCDANELRIGTTPNGFDWLYEILVEKPIGFFVQATTRDNPANPQSYASDLEASYSDALAAQEVSGQFVAITEGRAYKPFNRDVHAGAEFASNPALDWCVSYDFNRAPYSVVILQAANIDNPRFGLVSVIDEVQIMDADTTEATKVVIERLRGYMPADWKKKGIKVKVYADPSGQSRRTSSSQSDFDLIRAGFGAEFGDSFYPRWAYQDPGIISRVNAVNSMLKNAKGDVRTRIHPRCKNLIRDLEQVAWKKGTQELDKKTNKMLTHLSDALAYFVAEEFPAGDVERVGRF